MNWLNIETRVLHAPEYIGAKPVVRATWLNLMLWCASQENGGRITGAETWANRRWQQTAGVTLSEVHAATPLVIFDGADVVVWGYPHNKETEVRAKREAGKRGNQSRWGDSQPCDSHTESHTESLCESGKEGNEIGIGREEVATAVAGSPSLKPAGRKPSSKPVLTDEQWLADLSGDPAYRGIDVPREHAKMLRWCREKGAQPTRRRFLSWLNKCEPALQAAKAEDNFYPEFGGGVGK